MNLKTQREKENEQAEPKSPKEKKSPWKKLIPGNRSEREPGKISKIDSKPENQHDTKQDSRPPPQDGYAAAMAKPAEPRSTTETDRETSSKSSVELTPTGATMAGDGPSAIGAPDRMPEAEDEKATTPAGERGDPITETSSSRKFTSEEAEDTPSPASPSKKRFSRLMGKLKRSKKDEKKDSSDAAETTSFSGGAKLHKQRQDESRTASGATASSATAAGVALGYNPDARASSPSISSLSSSDDEQEERGRSATRLDRVASQVMEIKDSESDGEGDFEEARDRFDGELAPPSNILSKKHAESPVRDSKFVENI